MNLNCSSCFQEGTCHLSINCTVVSSPKFLLDFLCLRYPSRLFLFGFIASLTTKDPSRLVLFIWKISPPLVKLLCYDTVKGRYIDDIHTEGDGGVYNLPNYEDTKYNNISDWWRVKISKYFWRCHLSTAPDVKYCQWLLQSLMTLFSFLWKVQPTINVRRRRLHLWESWKGLKLESGTLSALTAPC